MNPSSTIFLVIPLYNEEANLPRILEQVLALPYSVIFVDDGSTDQTAKLLPQSKHVYIVRHALNRGVGAATQTGLDLAYHLGAEVVVTMDGDGQHDPDDIARLIETLQRKKADVVIGSRFRKKNKIPLLRRFYNAMGNLITFVLSGIYVSDSQSGFKAFNRHALEMIEIHSSGYEFCSEIIREISWYRLRYAEVPIHVEYFPENRGKGQNFARGLETIFKLVVRSLMR